MDLVVCMYIHTRYTHKHTHIYKTIIKEVFKNLRESRRQTEGAKGERDHDRKDIVFISETFQSKNKFKIKAVSSSHLLLTYKHHLTKP